MGLRLALLQWCRVRGDATVSPEFLDALHELIKPKDEKMKIIDARYRLE